MEWQRIIDLVKKTGERCVVIDPDHDEPVVVMPLSDYEFLADRDEENEFDFGLDDMPSDIPFEPEADWIPDFAQEEEPVLEVIEEHIHEETEPLATEESWYIEPIEGE